MEIVLDKKDATYASLKINLKEADYKPQVDSKLKEYGKKAALKGFRTGKVPAALINQMYGKGVLVEEISQIIATNINTYIKENNLNVIGEPLPLDEKNGNVQWENGKEFDFYYEIGMVPEFTYDLSGKFTAYKIAVDDKSIEETVDNLRKQFGRMITPEKSEAGDFVSGKVIPVGSSEEGKNTMIPTNRVVKGELAKFVGVKDGDKITFDPKKAFDNDAAYVGHALGITKEEAEKISGEYELVVDKISRSGLADLDQEFFDKVFGPGNITSEAEFTAKLKETMSENYARETKNLLIRDVRETLVDKTKIDLPKDFLKKWLLASNNGKLTVEQIDTEFDLYLKELKWTLIKNKFAVEKEVKVEHEEVLVKTKDMIKSQFGGMPLNEEMEESITKWAENYLKENKGKNYMDTYEQVLSEKTFDVLLENVATTEKTVDVEEFKTVVEKGNR